MKNVLGSRGEVSEDLRRILVLGPNELLLTFRAGEEALRGVLGDRPVDADDRALLETAATRALRPHDNEPLLAAIEDAWRPLLPRLENYGTLPAEQAEFLYNLAKSYLGYAGDPKRARDLAEALAGLGRDTLARWVIGECLLQERDIDGALAAWQALLAADPKNLDALFSLGMFHLDSRDYWQAEPFLSKAARLYPDTAVARYHLGRTLFYLGKNEAAIRELREAQRLSEGRETYPLVPYLVGIAAQKLNRHKEAAEALEAYLKWAYTQPLTRVEVDAHLKLADAYDSQGKRFQAHRERQKGEELRRRIETQAMQRGVEAVPPPPPAPPGATLDDSRVVGPSEDEPAAGGPGSPPSERP
jgi:tetratricopeptide (TPR) repeat protein